MECVRELISPIAPKGQNTNDFNRCSETFAKGKNNYMLQGKISEARYKSHCLLDGCYEHVLLEKLVYFQKTELIIKL